MTGTAERMLDDYNAGWVDDPSERLTAPEFIAHLSIRGIELDADGSMLVELADRRLFRGHALLVTGDAARAITDVEVAG